MPNIQIRRRENDWRSRSGTLPISAPAPSPGVSRPTPYSPYSRLKQTVGQIISGRLQGASQANQGRLTQQGIADVPGVQAAVSERAQGAAADQLAGAYASIDQQQRAEEEQKRQYNTQLEFAREQFRYAKSQADKAFWGDIIGSIIGSAGQIVATSLL